MCVYVVCATTTITTAHEAMTDRATIMPTCTDEKVCLLSLLGGDSNLRTLSNSQDPKSGSENGGGGGFRVHLMGKEEEEE